MTLIEALLIHEAAKSVAFRGKLKDIASASGKSLNEVVSVVRQSHKVVSEAKGYNVAPSCPGCLDGIGCLFPRPCQWPKQ